MSSEWDTPLGLGCVTATMASTNLFLMINARFHSANIMASNLMNLPFVRGRCCTFPAASAINIAC